MRTIRRLLVALTSTATAAAFGMAGPLAVPASADHTDPATKVQSTSPPAVPIAKSGTWEVIASLGANPGTDLEFFRRGDAVYASSGTIGQGSVGHVGQRIIQLVNPAGEVDVKWLADHGSANCGTANPSGTLGLQHDLQITPTSDPEILIDATDATGRCHDAGGGGMEIVDISGVGVEGGNEVREIHLTRHDGTSHNITVDATRPWIVYNSNSDAGRPWIDVVDLSSCLGLDGQTIDQKREACRPSVYRMPFDPSWTSRITSAGQLTSPYGCHDITAAPGRLYCAAINGTAVFDVTGLTDSTGKVNGTPLPCTVIDSATTGAKVTDCDLGPKNGSASADATAYEEAGKPAATGWSLFTKVNHPGVSHSGNQNLEVPSDQGISVSHEADPTPDGKYMLVTDERGGGVVPPGSSCAPGVDNPVGNGGMHVFDISDPANPQYAKTADGGKAVFLSNNVLPYPTFCNIHVIEQVPGEARIFAAWYSQGVKIIDYAIDDAGAWSFTEVGHLTLPGAQTWTAEFFHIVDNPDGTRTYYTMMSDIGRGIDVVSFTAPPNPLARVSAAGGTDTGNTDTGAARSIGDTSGEHPATGTTLPALLPLALMPMALAAGRLARRASRRRAAA